MEAATKSGVELWEGCTVDELLITDGSDGTGPRVGGVRGRRRQANLQREGPGRGHGGRQALAPGPTPRGAQISRAAGSAGCLLHLLERRGGERADAVHRPYRSTPRSRPTTTSRSSPSTGRLTTTLRCAKTSRAITCAPLGKPHPISLSASTQGSAKSAGSARKSRATSADRTAPAGRWSATPGTSRTPARRRA